MQIEILEKVFYTVTVTITVTASVFYTGLLLHGLRQRGVSLSDFLYGV